MPLQCRQSGHTCVRKHWLGRDAASRPSATSWVRHREVFPRFTAIVIRRAAQRD